MSLKMTLNLPPLPPQTTRFHTHPAPSWGHSRAPTEPGLCGAGTRTHGFPQAGRPPLQASSSPSQPGKPRRAGSGLGRAAPPPCSRGTHARTRRPSRDPRPFPLSPGSSRPAPAATPSLVYLPVRELLRLLSLRPLHQRGQPRQARRCPVRLSRSRSLRRVAPRVKARSASFLARARPLATARGRVWLEWVGPQSQDPSLTCLTCLR